MNGSLSQVNNTKKIAITSMFAAICIVSRVALQFLPNIKPVTSIMILITLYFGLSMGCYLAVIVPLVSGLMMGFGIYTPFQISAWLTIVLVSHLVSKLRVSKSVLFMSFFAGLMGYLFGFVVSFEKIFYGGLQIFWAYYLSGLLFDTLHAVGNVIFYPIMALVFSRVVKLGPVPYKVGS